MTERTFHSPTLLAMSLLSIACLAWWFFHNPVINFAESIPGRDNRPANYSSLGTAVEIGSIFMEFMGTPSQTKGTWPRFRGIDSDNINKESYKLADRWEGTSPSILWSIDLGEGHAGPVVANGCVYIMDYDEEKRSDILRCFSFEDGREIWRRGYNLFIKRNHGMSRTIPAVSENYVVTIGPMCHVMCVDALSGDFKWGLDLNKEFGTEIPLWYTGQCPLIKDNIAIIAVGGKSLIVGIDCESGEIVWETPNPQDWKMSHSSVMEFSIHGRQVFVYAAIGGIIGVAADREEQGKILFEYKGWNHNVIAPSPVYTGNGRIFLTAGYGAGSMMLHIKKENGKFVPESQQILKPDQGLASEQQTPIYYKGYLFSILPKDAGPLRNQLVCCHPNDFSKIIWSSGKTHRFGLGPFIVADGKMFILSDDGVLTVIRASTSKYIPLMSAKILDGVDAWGPLAIVNGRLLARDSNRLVCIDIRNKSL